MTARSALNFGDSDLAVSLSTKFVSTHPQSYELRSLQCYALYKAKRFHESLKSCDKAIKLNPSNRLSYRYQGLSYFRLGHLNLAEKSHSLAIKIQGEDLDFMNRGEVRWLLNKKKEACIDYKNALSTSRKALKVKPIEDGFDNQFIQECRKS
jgi:tetratricopeptide (TPR) repeat protein